MGIRTTTEVEKKMSLEHEKKLFKITIDLFVYAPYIYTSNLAKRIEKYIRKGVSHKKLMEITYEFKEVRHR